MQQPWTQDTDGASLVLKVLMFDKAGVAAAVLSADSEHLVIERLRTSLWLCTNTNTLQNTVSIKMGILHAAQRF
jgi:hypothetical protein